MAALSPETQARIAQLRAKEQSPEGLTLDDMREAVRLIRGDRCNAATASESSRRKVARAEIKSADEMLDEMSNL